MSAQALPGASTRPLPDRGSSTMSTPGPVAPNGSSSIETAVSSDQRVLAIEKLERSRRLLRSTLRRNAGLDRPATSQRAPTGLAGWAAGVWDKVARIPAVETSIDVLRGWWFSHPLHTAALVARDATRTAVTPYAKKNPIMLMAFAMVGGVVLIRVRPWRWIPRSLLLAGLLPRVAAGVVANVPVDSWLNAFAAFNRHRSRRQS